MEYRIELEEHAAQKMIHTTISGTMSETERYRIGVETNRKRMENNISKVIWDIREANFGYSLIGTHQVVLDISNYDIPKNVYFAIIYFHNKEQNEHAKTVANNRGLINLGYFQDLGEGINWLVSRG
jgi:hypothetical protein